MAKISLILDTRHANAQGMFPIQFRLSHPVRAKRNDFLTWQGAKQSGWIFPKCRQAELTQLVAPH